MCCVSGFCISMVLIRRVRNRDDKDESGLSSDIEDNSDLADYACFEESKDLGVFDGARPSVSGDNDWFLRSGGADWYSYDTAQTKTGGGRVFADIYSARAPRKSVRKLEIGGSSKCEEPAKGPNSQDVVHEFYEHSRNDFDFHSINRKDRMHSFYENSKEDATEFKTPERSRSKGNARTPIDIYMSTGSLKERRAADLQRRKSSSEPPPISGAGADEAGTHVAGTPDCRNLHEQQDPEVLKQVSPEKLHDEWLKKFTEVETENEIERMLILRQRLALRRCGDRDLLFLDDVADAKLHLGLGLDEDTLNANPLHRVTSSKECLIDQFLQDTAALPNTPQRRRAPPQRRRPPRPREARARSPASMGPAATFPATCPEAAPSLEFSLWGESEAGAGEGPGPQSAPGAPPTAAPKRNITRFVETEAANDVAEPPRTPTASGAQPVPFSSPLVSIEQVYGAEEGASCSVMPRPPRPRPRSRRLDMPMPATGTGRPRRGPALHEEATRMAGEEPSGLNELECPQPAMREVEHL